MSTFSFTDRPTIISASSASDVSGAVVPTTLPRRMTVIRSPIALTSRSLWVMKMIDVPRRLQLAHDLHQLVDLLRREHRRGLVEDQHLGVVGQRLDDLDALLHADRELLDEPVGVDLEPVPLGQLADPLGRLRPVQHAQAAGLLAAQHDVLGDGEHRDQHEVLVHHADAGARSRRRAR